MSLFVLSTAHPAGGLRLGVLITSDEKETTIKNGLEKLIQTLPSHAFYGNGPKEGLTLVMTDYSSAEKHGPIPSNFFVCFTFFKEDGHGYLRERAESGKKIVLHF